MRYGVFASVLLALAVTLPGAAGAAPGDLDASFGNGGKVTTDVLGSDDARAIAVLENGKIVVGGARDAGKGFALARYLPNGALDPVFGGDGTVETDFGGFNNIMSLAIQPNGWIVAAGHRTAPPSPSDFALARYRRDGSLDTTFDGDGMLTTDFGSDDFATDLVIQADRKILVAGNAGGNFALARYNEDGTLDTGFGVGGKVTTDFGASETALGIALQSDGRIVAAGRVAPTGGSADFALARYNTDGTLDLTFDADGKLTNDFGGDDLASDLAVQADGKIVVAGQSDPPGSAVADFALARFNVDGSLDTQGLDPNLDAPFGAGGRVTTDFALGADAAFAVALADGGKIVAAGQSDGGAFFAVVRYNLDGSLDSSFGIGGKLTTDFSPGTDRALDVAVQADGRILAAGGPAIASAAGDFALARYLTMPCCIVGIGPAAGG